jgi:molecular chaperone GrpE
MEEDKRVSGEGYEEPAKTSAEADRAAADASGGAQEMEALAAELRALREQNSEVNDRNLRLVAEMENLRRRTEREKSEFAKYAISEFARDMLTVADNLRRAIESAPKEAVLSHPALASLIEGVEVTERDLIKAFERYQVKRFDPLGEPFNPHLHEAMTKVEVPNVPADTIIQVIHAGYMIGERVLRPAAVIVAKGGSIGEAPKGGGEDGDIPPGAMRVPGEAVSSAAGDEGQHDEASFLARIGGLKTEEPVRTSRSADDPVWADERITRLRRPKPAGSGGRQQTQAAPQSKPSSSTLHKPVIGSKPEW